MGLKLFNTLTKSVEEFASTHPDRPQIGMYCCGPTVYDFAHIGNFRTFVFSDLVFRYLQFRGFQVRYVMNVTDVEDKIIARVRKEGRPLQEFTREKEAAFWEDFALLNCARPHETPRATDHIADIIQLIQRLIDRQLAYQASDGSVYFSIQKYRESGACYGRLLNLNFEQLRAGDRVRNDEYAKESAVDFALWKARVEEDGPVFWESPWGQGRPGWHIECSAMSMKLLGTTFDLHLGGEDLVFPHHEDEIAQSEGAGVQEAGRPFVRHWLHAAHLLVEGKKMSKSLGNFFTVRDLTGKGFTGREIRLLLIQAHYRESFNFTLEGLNGARTSLRRLDEWFTKLAELSSTASGEEDQSVIDRFTKAMDDDLNVSAAWAVIFEWVRETNRAIAQGTLTATHAAGALKTWNSLSQVLGIDLIRSATVAGAAKDAAESDPELLALVEQRQAARKARDFQRADTIRKELHDRGWQLEDTPRGPRLKRLS